MNTMASGKKQSKPNVILVGPAEEMSGLWLDLKQKYEVIGIFSDDIDIPSSMEKLGSESEALPFIKEHSRIATIYCHLNSSSVQELYLYSKTSYVEFYGIPPFAMTLGRNANLSKLGKNLLLSTEPQATERNRRYLVRLLFCILAFLIVIPILCIVMAIVVKRKSPGPILAFRKKIGRQAKDHTLISFRGFEKYCFDTKDAKFIVLK